MSELKDTKEKMSDNYNTDDDDYYGKRILPRDHWDRRVITIETKQTPAAYDPTEFLPGGVADSSGRINLNAKFQRDRDAEEKRMKDIIAAAK